MSNHVEGGGSHGGGGDNIAKAIEGGLEAAVDLTKATGFVSDFLGAITPYAKGGGKKSSGGHGHGH